MFFCCMIYFMTGRTVVTLTKGCIEGAVDNGKNSKAQMKQLLADNG